MAASSWSTVAHASIALILFVVLSLLSTVSFSYESSIYLQPGSPMVTSLAPYEVYEILVPVDSLKEGTEYWILASWNGGLS